MEIPVFPTGAVFIFNMIAVAPALPFARIDGHREGDCSAAAAPRLWLSRLFNDPASALSNPLKYTSLGIFTTRTTVLHCFLCIEPYLLALGPPLFDNATFTPLMGFILGTSPLGFTGKNCDR